MDCNRREFDPFDMWRTNGKKVETITPHKIVVVFLVQEYLKSKTEYEKKHSSYPPKYVKRFSLLLLKLIQYPDMSYKDLHAFLAAPKTGIDAIHLRRFEETMAAIPKAGVDMLSDFQSSVRKLITMPDTNNVNYVYPFSVVGFYVRRILIAMSKMQFSQILELYKSMVKYYEKGIRAITFFVETVEEDETAGSAAMITDTSLAVATPMKSVHVEDELSLCLPPPQLTNSKDRNGHSKWSEKQADLFIARQCSLLENNETEALEPKELQQRLNEISNDIPHYAQAHILSYMNSLRVRDVFNALDAFHCAYDRVKVRGNVSAAAMLTTGPGNETNTAKCNKGLQYSSLNLAILHVQFNHYEEALSSLRECVMLAQEAGDKICLQLAQSWLCLLDRKYVLLCENIVSNQTENTAVHAISLGVQFIVNVAAISGKFRFTFSMCRKRNNQFKLFSNRFAGVLPSKLFELLMKSEVINFQHNLMDLVANCLSQKAAVWQQYGKTELASLCNQLLLQIFRANKGSDCIENSESVCLSLCSVALRLSIQGDMAQCATVLEHASKRFPRDPLARNWQKIELYIVSQQAIYHCKWTDAAKACSELYMYDSTLSILQRSVLNISRRNSILAQKHLLVLLKDERLDPSARIRTMILLANTYFTRDMTDANDSHFSAEVIDILNRAAMYAKEKYLSYDAAMVDINTTYVLLTMGKPHQALKLINNCIETVLANGGIYDCAKTQFLFVRCLVATQPDRQGKIATLGDTATILEQCIQHFLKLESYSKVKDVYIYLATVYDDVKLMAERNKWSHKFHELEEQFPTPSEYLDIFL